MCVMAPDLDAVLTPGVVSMVLINVQPLNESTGALIRHDWTG